MKVKKEPKREQPKFDCLIEDCESKSSFQGFMGHLNLFHGDLTHEEKTELNNQMKEINDRFKQENPNYKITEMVEDMPEDAKNIDDIGQKAELVGKIRILMRRIQNLKQNEKDELSPINSKLREYLKLLSKGGGLPVETVAQIENEVEDNIVPELNKYTQKSPPEVEEEPEINPELTTKLARLNSALRTAMKRIAKLPPSKASELDPERTMIIDIIRRISKKDVTEERINEAEKIFTTHIIPTIDGIASREEEDEIKFPSGGYDADDDNDIKKMKKERLKMEEELKLDEARTHQEEIRELNRRKREAEIKKTIAEANTMQSPSNFGTGGMTPVYSPKLDPTTMKPLIDGNGNPIMEISYKPPGSGFDVAQMAYYKNLFGGGDGDNKVLITFLVEQQKLITSFMTNQNKGPSDDVKAILAELAKNNKQNPQIDQLQAENRQLMMTMMNNMNESWKGRLELERQTALNQINLWKQQASRDPIKELEENKQRFTTLGIWNNQKASTEEKAVDATKEMVTSIGDKLDHRLSSIENTLMQPMAEIMKSNAQLQAQQRTPRAPLSEEEKTAKYLALKQKLNELEEGK